MSFHPPPSYEDSSYRQLWPIIAPYVHPRDLLATCLVSREWHQAFAPQLWRSPARRFGLDLDEVSFSLYRFRSLLSTSRLEVRSLTRTFRVPEAELDLYEGPNAEWLRELLDYLPQLQTLILPGHQYFDHRALYAVHQCRLDRGYNPRSYPLRMLDASGCTNVTGTTLSALFAHLPDLIYLDLSGNTGTRNSLVPQKLAALRELRVLRLSNCRLGDAFVQALTLPSSLISLDVSNNDLTETGIAYILQQLPQAQYFPPPMNFQRWGEPKKYRVFSGNLDREIADVLENSNTSLTHLDEILPSSFSQLNISNNLITVEDVLQSLNHLGLDHLDCGPSRLSSVRREQSEIISYSNSSHFRLNLQLFKSAFGNLRSLRIHYTLVTQPSFELVNSETTRVRENPVLIQRCISLQSVADSFLQGRLSKVDREGGGWFLPSMLPNLKVLTLTRVPAYTWDESINKALIAFFEGCAEEENLGRLEFLFRTQSPKELPKWENCPSLPLKIRTVVLEMEEGRHLEPVGAIWEQSKNANNFTKSATEDPDGESFMQAGEADFSFFGEDRNGSRVRDGRVDASAFGIDKKVLQPRTESRQPFDTVSSITRFRKERRARYNTLRTKPNSDMEMLLCGHWIGEIRVLRPYMPRNVD